VHNELIQFSDEDIMRSIPSLCDGFKPSQRKILYASFLAGLDKKEKKVSQLAGFVSDNAEYHHGEASLMGAIIGMAQQYIGSNNINLLNPNGQFGTRRQGGKDSASPRYIFTDLNPLSSLLFRKEDFPILTRVLEDGVAVEPVTYAPILPMILVNGSSGIGTGWSTNVPLYNPKDLIKAIKNLMNKKPVNELRPWYRGFTGKIYKLNDRTFESNVSNTLTREDKCTVRITELPIGRWTDNYQVFLESIEQDKVNPDGYIDCYDNNSGNCKIDFKVSFSDDTLKKALKDKTGKNGVEKLLKLTSRIGISNMHLYSPEGVIKKYEDPEEIITDYYDYRLKMYRLRKEYRLRLFKNQLTRFEYQRKFIKAYIKKEIKLANRKKAVIEQDLEDKKYPRWNSDINAPDDKKTYGYILDMPLYSLTREKIEDLEKKYRDKKKDLDELKKKSLEEIWTDELDEFEKAYDKWIKEMKEMEEYLNTVIYKKGKATGKKRRKKN
jgi:DNA topoisomerase-2